MEYMYIRFAQKLNLQWVCACVFLLGMGAISYPKLVWLIPIGIAGSKVDMADPSGY